MTELRLHVMGRPDDEERADLARPMKLRGLARAAEGSWGETRLGSTAGA